MNIYSERIKKLQALMAEKNYAAYIILTDDYHASEYVGEYFKVREFMSGFTGSSGTLVVLKDKAYLWTDGRYFIQAEAELSGSDIELMKMGEKNVPAVKDFLLEKLSIGDRYAYDGRQVNIKYANALSKTLADKDITVVYDSEIIDKIWSFRPEMSHEKVWELDIKYAGESRKSKLEKVVANMDSTDVDYLLISSLPDIAWLLNIRGGDIEYCPMPLSFLLVSKKGANLYICREAVPEDLRVKLLECRVDIRDYNQVYDDLSLIGDGRVGLDYRYANVELLKSIKTECVDVKNPTEYLKSVKNKTEMENERKAHLEDGIALTKLIYRLKNGLYNHMGDDFTEIFLADELYKLRKDREGFISDSFAPIIATGEHGAIVHYEATPESDKVIKNNDFLLMDTGGHYLSGTTDVTRTVAIGEVNHIRKYHYTLVLKGHLRLAAARFKAGMTGAGLDILAREPLWKEGLDYNHGTGHGVGYLLNVHEGPQSFRYRGENSVAFAEGMITSNEPGLYIEGEYGIRLENLILTVADGDDFYKFETLTLAPFDRSAILVEMLSEEERKTLNAYHKKVYDSLYMHLEAEERAWLAVETSEV